MAKKGRPRKSGARTSADRLAQVRDYGNERVRTRIALFQRFHGDSSIGHEMSCAGRLMLVGAFDGLEHAPETCLASLLEYANGYWGNYGGGPAVAVYERQDRAQDGGDHTMPDPRGEYFARIDERLRSAGYQARRAVHEITVDRHWFPDEDVSWAARIINSRFVGKGLPVCGELACDSDWAMLDLLRDGTMALVDGPKLRRAA